MANTIDAGLKREKILNVFVEAFALSLLSLTSFSTDFSAEGMEEGDEVSVPYIPLAAAAQEFAGSYTIQDSDWQKKKVTLDKHLFVSMGLSDKDVMKTPYANLEQQARQKAYQLAKAVLRYVLSEVTAANYGAAVFTGAAGAFDLDDIADIRTAAVQAGWPKTARALALTANYYGAVVKDNNMQDASAAGGTSTRETGELPNLYTFKMHECEEIPDNGENLIGFAAHPAAMGVAMRYLKPQEGHTYFDARPLVHEETGIVCGFRDWYDNDTGTRKQVFECIVGKKVIEGAALKRLLSA